MKEPSKVLVRPVMSEKSDLIKKRNTYTFIVDKAATKPEIKNAVEKIYGVKVGAVNTCILKGKLKRNRNMVSSGVRADRKKAYVTLKAGSRIESL